MQKSWRNLYKAKAFRCKQRLHKQSEDGTSAWHILKCKQCYPDGCISFDWHCRKFDQKHKCPRGKKHVGKDCASCQFFYDVKNVYQPEPIGGPEKFKLFMRRLAEFEEWLEDLQGKRIEVRGRITRILPLLTKSGDSSRGGISCRGILLYFKRGIFHRDRFNDPFYARLSFGVYERAALSLGDEIDFEGKLEIDRGRFVFGRVGGIDLVQSGEGELVSLRELRQSRFTGSIIEGQPGKCMRCVHGLLIDDLSADGRRRPRRLLYCTQGVADYRYCPYRK